MVILPLGICKTKRTIDELKLYLNESINSKIDLNTLSELAEGISKLCLGEYGYTFFNPEENKIVITLGDSNPFDSKYLKEWFEDMLYSSDVELDIEIADEYTPKSDTGFYRVNKGKYTKH